MVLEKGVEGASCGLIQSRMPLCHHVTEDKLTKVGPAPACESVCVHGFRGGVAVEGELFQIRAALDEHVPQALVSRDSLICIIELVYAGAQLKCLPTSRARLEVRKEARFEGEGEAMKVDEVEQLSVRSESTKRRGYRARIRDCSERSG